VHKLLELARTMVELVELQILRAALVLDQLELAAQLEPAVAVVFRAVPETTEAAVAAVAVLLILVAAELALQVVFHYLV
jgi:hypothetical protein